ncbi:hypothetical protein LSAT2_023442 [Lamellibrachia satsuma]|nr:hypothetical protein LSAT2_023442 [Lamellibrachia satsuma]
MKEHNLPCFVEKDLKEQLGRYVEQETSRLLDETAQHALDAVRDGEVDVDQLIDKWTNTFTQEVAEYARPEAVTNELVFSEVYHALIHSPALETLLNFEHRYALAMRHITEEQDRDHARLEQRQRVEMEDAVHNLGVTHTDEQINQLAQRHFDSMQLNESKWASELSGLQDSQKREYVDWVMCVHEDTQAMQGTPSYVQQLRSLPSGELCDDEEGNECSQPSRKEESFTVHLGAQLKTMHNLRLIGADILDLCWHKPQNVGGVTMPQPERLQTAMSLYSNNLCALVLLVDNRLNSYTGIKREFAKVCEQSTDFHFPSLEQQFERIEADVLTANEWRAQQKLSEEGDRISVRSSGSSSSEKDDRNIRLSTGDFYMTRHSNLAEVHVVFHLVVDESVRTVTADISSRHPVLLGYRNVLKACFRYDIRTITLPLLLVHEMSEEMTIPWCLKRAELVFKCVKGFMMELGTWAGQQSRTIQFIVPSGLSEETFSAINNMLPSIFRMSNPVIAKQDYPQVIW